MREPQFAELFEEFAKQRRLAEGTDLLARVRDINDNYVVVNAGLKSEARIPLEEFYDGDNNVDVKVGDEVEVEIELLENGRGEAVLSRRNTRRKQAWKRVEEAFANEGILECMITSRVRGGFSASVDGLRAFLPGSLVDIFPHSDPSVFVGQKIEARPIKVNRARNSLVVSRRAVIERAMLEVKEGSMVESIKPEARFRGTVRAIVDYGAFVEIASGIYGLLHITDISWKHTASIENVFAVGDEIEVMVLSVDREKGRIALGMKQLQPNPWEFFDRAHPVGSRMFGKVTRAQEYGVFVEVEDGVQGLVHNSEMSWTRKIPNPMKTYSPGDEVEVMILEIDTDRRRISLGIKQCTPNPWREFAAAYRKGDRITGTVRSISEFGLFVELPGEIDGLVRMGELSYERPGEEAAREYQRGQEVEAVILAIDAERERISLGVKQIGNTGFDAFVDRHLRGTVVRGVVSAVVEKGAQITLEGETRGFLPIGEISEQRVENVGDFVKAGEEHDFILLNNDMKNMQAIVSLKEHDRQQREKALQERKKQAPPRNTLGAMLQAKIRESESEESGEQSAPDKE
ncbi:MAG: 30S ribosomal protein S1 [Gammaproteobacteria bacterium]